MQPPVDLKQVCEDVRATLQQMARWGCRGFSCSQQTIDRLAAWSMQSSEPAQPAQPETLESLAAQWKNCRRCPLCKGRTQVVFGEGDPKARLVFVGEGPGYEEDRSGSPFVGQAGELLTRIIEAMNLTRNQVYICNVVKCRPPGNRDPQPLEMQACRPCLDRQLDLIQPQIICALGKYAAQTLLEVTTPISKLRGRFFSYKGIKMMPTFHPAYLLRNPDQKRAVWEDMKKIIAVLSLPH